MQAVGTPLKVVQTAAVLEVNLLTSVAPGCRLVSLGKCF